MTDASSPAMRDPGAHPASIHDEGAPVSAPVSAQATVPVPLTLDGTREAPVIRLAAPAAPAAAAEAILARAEALTAQDTQVLRIVVAADPATSGRLLDLGAARPAGDGVEILIDSLRDGIDGLDEHAHQPGDIACCDGEAARLSVLRPGEHAAD